MFINGEFLANSMPSTTERGFTHIKGAMPEHVQLIVVTKGRTLGQIQAVIELGCRELGENRVKEAAEKIPEFSHIKGLHWHMIGHLQRNKARLACELFDMIQSVDRLKLANAIEKHCSSLEKRIPVLVEINISSEEQKHGVNPEGTLELCRQVSQLPHLELRGLMAMAPFVPEEDARPYFKKMRVLFGEVQQQLSSPGFDVLSMGMTSDYRVAIEEGSTMVRIGRAIFEPA